MRGALCAAAAALVTGAAAEAVDITAFSALPAGDVPPPWRLLTLANVKPAQAALVADEGATVLRVRSSAASASVAHKVDAGPRGLALIWRWKIDHVIEKADMTRKSGDDFAARVYVFFDVPVSELPWGTRIRLAAYRLIYGTELPTAALCYVWDNRNPVGTSQWNPYSDRVRMIVLRSGNGEAGRWHAERRDLEADFRAAFPVPNELPRITGIAAGNDTDQTGDTVTAWFGDFRLERAR